MNIVVSFLPIFTFVGAYVGSGLYFTWAGVEKAFYQVSPTVAILPALLFAWMLHKGSTNDRVKAFIDGVRHPDIVTMCILFFLAGAFGTITSSIGSVGAVVNLAVSLIPSQFLIIGIFIACALISTAIGTSMGTIATCAPIAAGLAHQGAFSMTLAMATVVGGSMFGDSLSMISDTTIAAVLSQGADMKKKFKINAVVAIGAALVTIGILFFLSNDIIVLEQTSTSLFLILPYAILIGLAFSGLHPFVVLFVSLIAACIVGYVDHGYSLITFGKDIDKGFVSMHDIALLSLLIGGLSGLSSSAITAISALLEKCSGSVQDKKIGQYLIGALVSVCDLLMANNTVAIVFSGQIAKDIARRHKIPSHYTAAWLDVFSCVVQGLIPYGAQVLLASSVGGISPLSIVPEIYYCYVLFGVTVVYIAMQKKLLA
jgi:Na+/H+ antiporter NhaC